MMDDDNQDLVLSPSHGILTILATMMTFVILNRILARYAIPAIIKQKGKDEIWKWKNLLLSWLHAFTVGVWDLSCFMLYPELMDDLILHVTPMTYYLVAVSAGYFLYDFIDMIIHGQVFKMWELSLHHIAVTSMFVYNVVQLRCVGYNVVALLAEVNSFFLHSRKLMQMLKYPFDHKLYRYNAIVNIVTFAVCRGWSLWRITYGMYLEHHRVDTYYFYCLCFSMFIMDALNPVLFYILLRNDFFPRQHQRRRPGGAFEDVNGHVDNHNSKHHHHSVADHDLLNNNNICIDSNNATTNTSSLPSRRHVLPDVFIPDLDIDKHKIE